MKSIGMSFSLKVLVMNRKQGVIEMIDPMAMSRCLIHKYSANTNLLLFDWVRKCKTANFFIVTSAGIQTLLVDEATITIKKKETYGAQIENAWFDPVRQFLAIHFYDSQTELKVYDMNKIDDGLNLKQPAHQFSLNLGDTLDRIPLFNTNQYYERCRKTAEANSTTLIDFINLYNECYILHINSELGDLTLHEVGGIGSKSVRILAESSLILKKASSGTT